MMTYNFFTKNSFTQDSIIFSLNGKIIQLHEGEFDPLQSLAEFIRSDSIHLTGTKIGCSEGGCGSCTVVISYYLKDKQQPIVHRAVNSCLLKLIQVHKTVITTIEYLGSLKKFKSSKNSSIHPIQNSFIKHSATQCGYCTPGFIMSAYASILNQHNILNDKSNSDTFDIEDLHKFDGNLCRCTGYRSIIDSLREFSKSPLPSDDSISYDETGLKTYEMSSRIPIIPDFFKEAPNINICIHYKGIAFIIPDSVENLLSIKKECIENNCSEDTRIIVGSTEISVDISQNRIIAPKQGQVFISTFLMPELSHISIENGNEIVIGANTPLNDILKFIKEDEKVKNLKTIEEKRFITEFIRRIETFGSNQIRNVASIVGNICHGGAATDISNFLLAMKATLVIKDCLTQKTITREMDNSFYLSYRKVDLKPSEIVIEIKLKIPNKNEFVSTFKQGHRRDDDICIVSSTIFASVSESNTVEEIRVAYSGMSAFPVRATLVENFLRGKTFSIENIEKSFNLIDQIFPLDEKSPGGFPKFRLQVSKSFLFRFFHQTQRDRGLPYDQSATEIIDNPAKKAFKIGGCHCKEEKKKSQKDDDFDVIGLPFHHSTAASHVTGESVFVDDMANTIDTLHAAFVTSSIPHGRILDIDFTESLLIPGVIDKVTKEDIKGKNYVGDLSLTEPVFAEEEVNFIGQPIALIVAKTADIARKAAKLVKVKYEELPSILSIKQAIEENSFFPYNHTMISGDPDSYFNGTKNDTNIHIIEGEMSINGQSHFYLEPSSVFVVPGIDDDLTVYAPTQHPSLVLNDLCRVNNIESNKINVVVNRIGGAFGGKETRICVLSNAASVAALKLGCPIKLTLTRSEDMTMQGQRHPLFAKYKAAFDNKGVIHGLNLEYFFDCGWSLDMSSSVCDKALIHATSAYHIKNFSAIGHICKTNLITCTAFRGFGIPQASLLIETAIEKVSNYLHKNCEEVRYLNLFNLNGDINAYGLKIEGCTLKECFETLVGDKKFDLKKRREEADKFNKNSKYKKIGISVTPMIYTVGFSFPFMNQGFANVSIFKDGSVKVFHGGCEMGQGLNTKMAQIAASSLSIPIEKIEVRSSMTDHVPNPSPTSGSSGADLNGGAVLNACEILKERLKKYREAKGISWEEAVRNAYFDQVDLTSHANFTIDDVKFDWKQHMKNQALRSSNSDSGYVQLKPCKCFSFGCSASIVMVDLLTGDHQILRTDVVIDAGSPLNEAIDVGQVEGGLLQGIGYLTLEDVIIGRKPREKEVHLDSMQAHEWLQPGCILTNGTTFYKIPSIGDVPHELNINLLERKEKPAGLFGSKACSESPVILALSVPLAILDAIKNTKDDENEFKFPSLHFPMSAPRIKELVDMTMKK